MPGWNHYGTFKPKACLVCGAEFKPRSGVHKFCSEKCKGKHKYITGAESTENQYKKISGDWGRYFARLLCMRGRKKLKKEELLLLLKKQNGRCAISGVEMTCTLEKGSRNPRNASIDRVVAGGVYSIDNIQLVCSVVNRWRSDTPLEVFIDFCERVAKWKIQKEI